MEGRPRTVGKPYFQTNGENGLHNPEGKKSRINLLVVTDCHETASPKFAPLPFELDFQVEVSEFVSLRKPPG